MSSRRNTSAPIAWISTSILTDQHASDVAIGLRLADAPRDDRGIDPAELARLLGIDKAPHPHRLRAPFFKGDIIKEGIRPRREDLMCDGRGLAEIARDASDLAA